MLTPCTLCHTFGRFVVQFQFQFLLLLHPPVKYVVYVLAIIQYIRGPPCRYSKGGLISGSFF